MAEYAQSIISQCTGTKLYGNDGVNGLLWGREDGWVVGGVGPCKKKYFPKDSCLKLPWQMRHSAARHEGNDLVNVTFISLSVGNSFTIVVFFVPASETYIISPFMCELTWQPMLSTITPHASFALSLRKLGYKRTQLTISVVMRSTYFSFHRRPEAN